MTTPALVTVAMAELLLIQVPPLVGVRVDVWPIHNELAPAIDAVGFALKDIDVVGSDAHIVALLVKIKKAVPAAIAFTTPALLTVATALLLLAQIPPEVGDKVVVDPTHKDVEPVMLIVGLGFTVTDEEGSDIHVELLRVKVNETVPAPIPVTIPALVTEATDGLLLTQVPPLDGVNVVVWPIQILEDPDTVTMGFTLIEIEAVGSDAQSVALLVNIKDADPAEIALTTPALVTVAIELLLLAQVPPEVGDNVVVDPTHKDVEPVMDIEGFEFTVMFEEGSDEQDELSSVNVKLAVPAPTPVTIPALVTVATEVLLLTQVPPVEGESVVVVPTQIAGEPVILATGFATTVIALVAFEMHPVDVSVKVNVAVPAPTEVTTPAFVTVATDVLLLTHVPPVVGERVVVAP